jgi:alpha-N-arabinofuranosidase
MRPEYYADQYRQYSLYARNYGDNRLFRIACGSHDDNYNWTEVLMEKAGQSNAYSRRPLMDGLSLHYYTSFKRLPDGSFKESATQFGEAEWIEIIAKSLRMDELIRGHARIMDKYDPEQKVALIVDEWGTWYAVEPGTNPGFLYQQNTMRDALVAATQLDIFNKHCDRVRMANIAQTINVLQAMILTQKDKLLVTPTYHVFDMYAVHQDATLAPLNVHSEEYSYGDFKVPAVSASASIDADGKMHVTLSNANPNQEIPVIIRVDGVKFNGVHGQVLAADAMNAHNTFDHPNAVTPKTYPGARVNAGALALTMPKMSVMMLELT